MTAILILSLLGAGEASKDAAVPGIERVLLSLEQKALDAIPYAAYWSHGFMTGLSWSRYYTVLG